jgi:hypothetical protein
MSGLRARLTAMAAIAVAAAATVAASSAGGQHAAAAITRPAYPAPLSKTWLVGQVQPSSQIVTVHIGSTREYVWFGRLRSDPGLGQVQCLVAFGGMYGSGEDCVLARAGFLSVTIGIQDVIVMGTLTGPLAKATSVALNRSPGVIVSSPGFPARVWLAQDTSAGSATVVFRDAAGAPIGRQVIGGDQPTPPQPAHGGITVYRYRGGAITAYRLGAGIGFWATNSSSVISGEPIADAPYLALSGLVPAASGGFGYAPANIARVGLRLANGTLTPSVRTIAAWRGSGIRLWGALALPAHADPLDTLLVGYDPAGHVLARVPLWFAGSLCAWRVLVGPVVSAEQLVGEHAVRPRPGLARGQAGVAEFLGEGEPGRRVDDEDLLDAAGGERVSHS